MPIQDMKVIERALSRARRISKRFRDRVEGKPLRAAERSSGRPVPPGRLLHLIANTEDVSWFLETGALAARSIREVLHRNGLDINDFKSILDFGCGAGRVIRQWSSLQGPSLHGTDYNPALVTWCRANIPFARFQVNGLDSPLEKPSASFDFIYCLSVFTHLSESLQRFWMGELSRVLKPGGLLLITTHGDHYLPMLSASEQEFYRAGHLVVKKAKREGSNDCAAFHPERYVRETLARGFEVVDMIPEGALGNPCQDLYLIRKSNEV
jgi:SAM-dependent methyltransferase